MDCSVAFVEGSEPAYGLIFVFALIVSTIVEITKILNETCLMRETTFAKHILF